MQFNFNENKCGTIMKKKKKIGKQIYDQKITISNQTHLIKAQERTEKLTGSGASA